MTQEKTIYQIFATDIANDLPEGVAEVNVLLNPSFSQLDFEELRVAMGIICPYIKLIALS